MKKVLFSAAAAVLAIAGIAGTKANTNHRAVTYFKYLGINQSAVNLTTVTNWVSLAAKPVNCTGTATYVCTAESTTYLTRAALVAQIRTNGGVLPPSPAFIIDSKKP